MPHTFDHFQQEAIQIEGGRHLVLAPPGCGKTDILTERVIHAHNKGVEYRDMLCLTFTNRAAKGMAQRIADRSGNPVPDELFVGNIHRFCSQMLFNEGIVNNNSAIIDDADVDNIIQEDICRRLGNQHRTTDILRYQHALYQLTLGMRGEAVLHGDLLLSPSLGKLCSTLGLPFCEDSLAEIYSSFSSSVLYANAARGLQATDLIQTALEYQRYKEDNDLIDYDDLLILAHRHLQHAGERFSWIEVDEVQDLNGLQMELIDLLATPDATIVYLGDEQQAIFSFIGAKLETLQSLKQRCAGKIHHLHNNYRSPKYLLQLQNDFAERCLHIPPSMHPKTDYAPPMQPSDLCLIDAGSAATEADYTARLAKRYGEMDGGGRVAILVSTNREADEVSLAMDAHGNKHFKISGADLFSDPTVRLILAHLTVVTDETVFIAWARLLWGLRICPSYSAAREAMREMRRTALSPTDFFRTDGRSYVQEMVRIYNEEEIVIFDTETTGLDPEKDDIIQIAAIKVRQGKKIGKLFNIIIESEREIPEFVGGNPNPMRKVYNKAHRYSREEGLKKFMQFCHGSILVGHNVGYDYNILAHNLRRSLPEISLEEVCPLYYDTLKYIRLVRPRLRRYKLVHLIETLHLSGENSHKADDDIMATLSLLNFCHNSALQLIGKQELFYSNYENMIKLFRDRYSEIYQHSMSAADPLNGTGTSLSEEADFVYRHLTDDGSAQIVEKWEHLLRYIDQDLVRAELYPTLHKQLARYITDLCTSKEADICGGSMEEKYIVSTVHKAKGLEFETVFVYHVLDDTYPSPRSWTTKQIEEDARRLFVAISRAKKSLCIVYSSLSGHTTHSTSPFIEKVMEHFAHFRRGMDGKVVRV